MSVREPFVQVSPWQETLYGMCKASATEAYRQYVENVWQDVFLWFQPAENGKWGKLAVSEDYPAQGGAWSVVTPAPVPRSMAMYQLVGWIWGRVQNIPLIGDE